MSSPSMLQAALYKKLEARERRAERVARRATEADQLLREVQHNMKDSWREDRHLAQRLFPLDPGSSNNSKTVQSRNYNATSSRWKKIPVHPKALSGFLTPLRMLMNDILICCGISYRSRRILDTCSRGKKVFNSTSSPISPTLYLTGVGAEFAGTVLTRPQTDAVVGVCPIEVILDSDDVLSARDRLAVNVQQLFADQANRRFMYGLIITETMCTVYMFDHSGAIASEPFNYHEDQVQFCAVISGLATIDAKRAGFDLSIIGDRTRGTICTWEPLRNKKRKKTHYTILHQLFHFSTLVGRGTICWLTYRSDQPGSRFVIKDAWIAPALLAGRETEGSLMRHVQSMGIVHGVVQLQHYEELRCGPNAEDLDTVFRNRGVKDAMPDEKPLDRVHTRIVMKTYGKTLDAFSNRRELLLAFHDAVLAHRKLHDVAGILHRDISVRNILINPNGVEGDRGILIDFDHAIRIGDTSPYSTQTRMGTYRFMSRNVLEEIGPHTYIDDLESFYFVLCWIVIVYSGPAQPKAIVPKEATFWDDPRSSSLKRGHFTFDAVRLPLDPWFGSTFHDLIFRLFCFFKARKGDLGKPLSALSHHKDYEEFLSHIQKGIVDLETEETAEASISHDL